MQRMKWKKWIILVVAMALLLSDVPIVLAKTQRNANKSEGVSTIEIDNEMAKQSVSGGEIDQKEILEEMEESVSTYGTESGENETTVINMEVIEYPRTTFYYKIDYPDVYGLVLKLTLSNGEVLNVQAFDEIWDAYNISRETRTVDGDIAEYIDGWTMAKGEYRWEISIFDIEQEIVIPFSVVDIETAKESLQEIFVDTSYSITGSMQNRGTWFQFIPEKTGRYGLTVSGEGDLGVQFYDEKGNYIENSIHLFGYDAKEIYWMEGGQTYYLELYDDGDSEIDFNIKLTKELTITDVQIAKKPQTTYYYGIDAFNKPDYSELILRLTFDNNEQKEVKIWDENWETLDISCKAKTIDGDSIEYVDGWITPPGEYRWEITMPAMKNAFNIPYKVVEPKSVMPSLVLDTTYLVEGLEVRNDEACYQFVPEETSRYSLSVVGDSYFYVQVYDEEGNAIERNYVLSQEPDLVYERLEKGKTYYYKVGNYYSDYGDSESIEIMISKEKTVTSVEMVKAPDTTMYYYGLKMPYGFEEPNISGFILKLTFDDQSEVLAKPGYKEWNDNDFVCTELTINDENIVSKADGQIPKGEYKWVISTPYVKETFIIPYSVREKERMPFLIANTTYSIENNPLFDTGVWYQFIPKETGVYGLSVSGEGFTDIQIVDTNGNYITNGSFSGGIYDFELTEDKTYYFYICYSDKLSDSLEMKFINGNAEDLLVVPSISKLVSLCGGAQITWEKVSGATGYKIYRRSSNGNQTLVATIDKGSTVTYKDDSVKVGMEYVYTVVAIKGKSTSAYSTGKTITIRGHQYENKVIKKATLSKNGVLGKVCKDCGEVKSKTTIYAAKNIKLKAESYSYTKKKINPTVNIYDSKGNKINKSNYSVSYKNNKNVGIATVTITFKGNYSGKITKQFTITPPNTSILKLMGSSNGLTVKWKVKKEQVSGYQIQYATNKKFVSAKIVTVNKNTTTSKKIMKLSKNKRYYVRVRTFKKVTVNGKAKKVYSAWSAAKSVKTPK